LKKIFKKLRKFKRKLRFLSKIYKLKKFKVRKISQYNIVVKKSWNNYFLTAFSRFNGSVFEKITGAASQLKGSKRSTTTSLERISHVFIKELINHKILRKKFDFTVQTPYLSKGVKNTLRNLVSYKRRAFSRTARKAYFKQLKIRNIILDYKLSHNGFA
jgi:hypothetical protein